MRKTMNVTPILLTQAPIQTNNCMWQKEILSYFKLSKLQISIFWL